MPDFFQVLDFFLQIPAKKSKFAVFTGTKKTHCKYLQKLKKTRQVLYLPGIQSKFCRYEKSTFSIPANTCRYCIPVFIPVKYLQEVSNVGHICQYLNIAVWSLLIFYLEPERIRHRLCMDDLCCAFREMTNRLRSTLSKAKEQSNWLCLLQFYRNGIFFPCSAYSPGLADRLVSLDSGGNSKSHWKNVFEISSKYNKGNQTNDN